MDQPVPYIVGSFIAGWLARDWVAPKADPLPPCRCECNCQTTGSSDSYLGSSVWVVLALTVGLVLIFSNTALALRFSYRDHDSGLNKEFSLGVKGKSKGSFGIYGVSKGLAITD